MFICLEKIKAPTTTFYMSDVAFAHFPLKAFVTSADGPKRSLWWSPDRLFWVFTPEFIYKQSGRSPGGAWWFLTSRQADVQRAWIKHMASSDHGLQAFQESNEIWAVISIHKKKPHILLSDFCDAALNMYDIFAAWPEWLSSYDNQSPDRFVKAADGKESEWAPRYQPGISTGASCDQWQVFTNWWSTVRAGWRSDAWLFHTSRSLKCGAFLFPPRSEGRTRQFSSAGGEATECVTTPPTQSWSSTAFKKEKQSQNSAI